MLNPAVEPTYLNRQSRNCSKAAEYSLSKMNWARCTKRSGQGREADTCRICASLEAETGQSWSRFDIVYSRKKRDETAGSTLPPEKTPSQREDHLESGSPEQPQPMAETDADRFLNAFNETERHLQTVLQEDKSTGFKKLVREQGNRRVGPVRTHEDELKDLADLRNTIVHSPRRDGVAIAEPRSDIVERMEELKSLIIEPPNVLPPI